MHVRAMCSENKLAPVISYRYRTIWGRGSVFQRIATGGTVRVSNPSRSKRFLILMPYRPTLGPNQPPLQLVQALFLGDKAAGTWPWLPTPICLQYCTCNSLLCLHGGKPIEILNETFTIIIFSCTALTNLQVAAHKNDIVQGTELQL